MRRALWHSQVVVLVASLVVPVSVAADPPPGHIPRCAANPEVVGDCFQVHGRLFAANGTPSLRIWIVGTKRILGIHNGDVEQEYPGFPDCLSRHIGFRKNLYADFLVCPLSPDIEGWMRSVCIESASSMVVEDYSTDAEGETRVHEITGLCTDP